MIRLNRWMSLLVTPMAVVAVVGCGAHDPASQSTPSARVSLPSPSSTPSPSEAPAEAVQHAVSTYREMWSAYNAAVHVPNPADPALARVATGAALHTLVTGLNSVKSRGLKGVGDVVVSPHVTDIFPVGSPSKVSLQDCFNDGATELVRASPGPPFKDTPGGRRLCLATVERQADGTWKVTTFALRAVGTC